MPVLSCRLRKSLPLLLLALLLGGCSEDKVEKMLGGQVSRAIEASYRPIDDPTLQDWISYVGHTTVGVSTRQHIPYRFSVLDSDSVNAMAAPWGHVYFMRGLLDFAEDEDEVWIVMGHEVGHVVHRDIIKAIKRTFLWNVGLTVVNSKSQTMADVLGVGLGLLSFHYSREDERDADEAGIWHTYLAGHDPRAGPMFFTRLMEKYEKDKPSKLEALLRTHPLTSSRIEAQKALPECDPQNAEALARIGRGYASRGRHLQGMQLLQQALDINPKLPSASLALAEAALRRGYVELAQQQLVVAADVLGYVPSLARQTQIAAATQPQQWPEYSPEERQRLASAVGGVGAQKATIAQGQALTIGAHDQFAASVQPLSGTAGKLAERLDAMSQVDAQVTEPLQNLLIHGNAAVSQTSDLVARLEGIADQVAVIADKTGQAAELLERAKQMPLTAGPAGTAGWIERSGRELLAAQQDAARAASLAGTALEPTRKALASSQDAAVYMDKLLALGENQLLMDSLRVAAATAERHAQPVREAVKEARKTAARAEARVALARINLAAVGATPEELNALGDIVAYFARVPGTQVADLVGRGAGLGEAAACLLASKGCRRSATDLLSATHGTSSIIDAIDGAGASMAATQILLKFVAQAVQQELPTGQHDAPRFTS